MLFYRNNNQQYDSCWNWKLKKIIPFQCVYVNTASIEASKISFQVEYRWL